MYCVYRGNGNQVVDEHGNDLGPARDLLVSRHRTFHRACATIEKLMRSGTTAALHG